MPPINVTEYGCVLDGVTDNGANGTLQAAINAGVELDITGPLAFSGTLTCGNAGTAFMSSNNNGFKPIGLAQINVSAINVKGFHDLVGMPRAVRFLAGTYHYIQFKNLSSPTTYSIQCGPAYWPFIAAKGIGFEFSNLTNNFIYAGGLYDPIVGDFQSSLIEHCEFNDLSPIGSYPLGTEGTITAFSFITLVNGSSNNIIRYNEFNNATGYMHRAISFNSHGWFTGNNIHDNVIDGGREEIVVYDYSMGGGITQGVITGISGNTVNYNVIGYLQGTRPKSGMLINLTRNTRAGKKLAGVTFTSNSTTGVITAPAAISSSDFQIGDIVTVAESGFYRNWIHHNTITGQATAATGVESGHCINLIGNCIENVIEYNTLEHPDPTYTLYPGGSEPFSNDAAGIQVNASNVSNTGFLFQVSVGNAIRNNTISAPYPLIINTICWNIAGDPELDEMYGVDVYLPEWISWFPSAPYVTGISNSITNNGCTTAETWSMIFDEFDLWLDGNAGLPAPGDKTGAASRNTYALTAPPTLDLSDTTAPTVTAFAIPANSTTLTVPITSLTATDDVAVTGYLLTESGTPPLPDDAGWSATAPTSYTFANEGAKTLYAWAKDAAGNVSAGVSDSVVIALAPTSSLKDNQGNAAAFKSAGGAAVTFYDGSGNQI
jgi:hypothetical protein